MSASFTVRELPTHDVEPLADALGVRPLTARCLLGRGISERTAGTQFLEPRLAELRSPDGLADLDKLVTRLSLALGGAEKIGVFGDYDVDGATTAALLTTYLRQAGGECVARVAKRDAGYGFGLSDVDFFVDAGCTLIITGDCGTSDIAAIESASARGVDVVVIDHHTVPSADMPHPAHALVNPFRADSSFPFQGMASVGLAFYAMAALRTRLRKNGYFALRKEPGLADLLDLVAVGTIADLVPLTDENRIMTSVGLKVLSKRQRPGLAALLQSVSVMDRDVGERAVSWKLAPRLNAPGRLGDAAPALDLLLARTKDEAKACAAVLEQANQARREAQDHVYEEVKDALATVEPGPAIVVSGRGWASGVVGIVASKLVDQYQCPAFVIAIDAKTGVGRGSARSARGVNLYQALSDSQSVLERFGGHAAAAGLTIRGDAVEEFHALVSESCARQADSHQAQPTMCDASVSLAELDERAVRELMSLAPFGQKNPEPMLHIRATARAVRTVGDGSHLKLTLADRGVEMGAIAFGLAESAPLPGEEVELLCTPEISTWGGRSKVELRVHHVQPAQALDAHASPRPTQAQLA